MVGRKETGVPQGDIEVCGGNDIPRSVDHTIDEFLKNGSGSSEGALREEPSQTRT